MRTILLSPRNELVESYGENRNALDVEWARLLFEIDCLPVMTFSGQSPRAYFEMLNPRGVLLTGGNTLSCLENSKLSRDRDQLEKIMVDLCLEREIPIFGVCRGMQFLVDYFGAELEFVEGHVAVRHDVAFQEGSRWFQDSGVRNVNSFHKYGLRNLPDDLVPAAHAPDGTIEAFEHSRLQVAGQMWHPERESPFLPDDPKTLTAFFHSSLD
jgi:N5-(cytidine 5'-diphosphoramidyl)-L-glutamine hydrolase